MLGYWIWKRNDEILRMAGYTGDIGEITQGEI